MSKNGSVVFSSSVDIIVDIGIKLNFSKVLFKFVITELLSAVMLPLFCYNTIRMGIDRIRIDWMGNVSELS